MKLILLSCLMCFSVSAEQVAQTILAKHHVVANTQDTSRALKRKSKIFHQDFITTGKLARAQFRFQEGTILTLGADTRFLVADFSYTHAQNTSSASFEFIQGAFRVVTGEITKVARPNFKIKTPLGSIGIRGTDFWGGHLYDTESIEVILLDSEHPLTIENQFGKVVISEPGTGSTLRKGKPPTQPVKWSKQKLQDAVKTIQ
ncbi:FecR family protein [Pseudoalteromonas sp. SMS1]|uniref:FecR family protein n=1 Tax=Pseudoalteromonas sp. SMS1 TaxID=2908894 RepID=UPI001F3D669D|nr:FecR family protein [Pseudoalteromonas sp. SMS1]MCF2858025.1 FecR family protein [Pseudoalteromonas sp. SMS1]